MPVNALPPLLIKSVQGDYPVHFDAGIEDVVRRLQRHSQAVVLADRRVAGAYARQLAPLLEKMPSLLLDATEETKTLDGVTKAVHWLQDRRCTRQSVVVTIGGGIIQDVAAFSSHIYYRGIRWVFVPTTLLSMSDSCIGAKCGINLREFKNQLGVFHSPSEVVICTRFLDSLGEPAFLSGCGEMYRLMLTGPKRHYEEFHAAVRAHGMHGIDLPDFIRRSLEVKKGVIELDEHEGDLRRILNYGHTFGHALEALTQYEVPHGIAVAWGLDLVNYIALRKGLLKAELFESIHQFVMEFFPFRLSSTLDAAELIRFSKRDKKVAEDGIHLVLMEEPGKLKIVKTPFDDSLLELVADFLTGRHAFSGR